LGDLSGSGRGQHDENDTTHKHGENCPGLCIPASLGALVLGTESCCYQTQNVSNKLCGLIPPSLILTRKALLNHGRSNNQRMKPDGMSKFLRCSMKHPTIIALR